MNEIDKKILELKNLIEKSGIQVDNEIAVLEEKIRSKSAVDTIWNRVELARHPERPYSMDYITRIFDDFIELHGDRTFGDDPAIIGGLAFLNSSLYGARPVTILAHQKGRTLKEKVYRNHGMANPEGYRKALRLAKEAEKFHRPVITFIDTPGAYPGLGAEERCISEAIARNLMTFSQLSTPVICIIIGEGGSGGALGLGIGDKVYMLENAIYSVISPEGCASILLRDASKAKDAAAMLRITAKDLLELKIIDGVIPEPPASPSGRSFQAPSSGIHNNFDEVVKTIKNILIRDMDEICNINPDVLVHNRNQKFNSIGYWNE
jgi:acetyl-CoA carboxylase carboxyl transferase subunit alpha